MYFPVIFLKFFKKSKGKWNRFQLNRPSVEALMKLTWTLKIFRLQKQKWMSSSISDNICFVVVVKIQSALQTSPCDLPSPQDDSNVFWMQSSLNTPQHSCPNQTTLWQPYLSAAIIYFYYYWVSNYKIKDDVLPDILGASNQVEQANISHRFLFCNIHICHTNPVDLTQLGVDSPITVWYRKLRNENGEAGRRDGQEERKRGRGERREGGKERLSPVWLQIRSYSDDLCEHYGVMGTLTFLVNWRQQDHCASLS